MRRDRLHTNKSSDGGAVVTESSRCRGVVAESCSCRGVVAAKSSRCRGVESSGIGRTNDEAACFEGRV
jgi:hypothetical protein